MPSTANLIKITINVNLLYTFLFNHILSLDLIFGVESIASLLFQTKIKK